MKFKGNTEADWGSRTLVDGWHLAEIDKVEDFTNKNNKRSLTINFKIVEGESEGAYSTLYCDWDTEFGERKIANVLLASGLEAAFEKAFPGDDTSMFNPKVLTKLMRELPGYQVKIYIDTNKSGYQNINRVVSPKADIGGKAASKSAPRAAKTTGEEWPD